MSYRYPTSHEVSSPTEDHRKRIEDQINHTIEHIIMLLHVRRAELLLLAHNKLEDIRAKEESRQKCITELGRANVDVEDKMHLNALQLTQESMKQYIMCSKQGFIGDSPPEMRTEWTCDLGEIESCISHLGDITEVVVGLPNYDKLHDVVATGKMGVAPGELKFPYGVAIHESTNRICVADSFNSKIKIFSETGDYLEQLPVDGNEELNSPFGIAIHGDNVYVSCWDHSISKLSLTEKVLVRKRGEYGQGDGQFDYPNQLAISPKGKIFIADSDNNRICIYDTNLCYQRSISHESISRPFDVKISGDKLCVLCPYVNPCMHVLTQEGVKLRSLISLGRGNDVFGPLFFCMDPLNNFVISDQESHSIRVFSHEGKFLHEIGKEGHEQRMFFRPQGIAITPSSKLVCVSNNKNFGLQIFC